MDLSVELREHQAAANAAETALTEARRDLDTSTKAYEHRRRYASTGRQTDQARAAWGLNLITWAQALIARETARDRVKTERRDVDETAMNALMGTERPLAYDANDDPPAGA